MQRKELQIRSQKIINSGHEQQVRDSACSKSTGAMEKLRVVQGRYPELGMGLQY